MVNQKTVIGNIMISLEVIKGLSTGRLFEFDSDRITIGRNQSNSLYIDSSFVSSRHAEIVREDTDYLYRDLKSINGSLVRRGDKEILLGREHEYEITLADKDQIIIGAVPDLIVLEFRLIGRKGRRCEPDHGKADDEIKVDFRVDGSTVVSKITLENLERVSSHLRRDHDALQVLYRFALGLQSVLGDKKHLLNTVGDLIFELFTKAQHLMILANREGEEAFEPVLTKARAGTTGPMPLSRSVINRIREDQVSILIEDVGKEFDQAKSLIQAGVRSVVCAPLWSRRQLRGILQVTSGISTGLFDQGDLEILTVLAGQLAAALENADLLDDLQAAEEQLRVENESLEERVAERTRDLERALDDLHSTQTQLVQTEKMASLGLLVAGVAHELNNPISFIYGNIDSLQKYIEKLSSVIASYERLLLNDSVLQDETEKVRADMNLEFIQEDLTKLLRTIRAGATRSKDIVADLRTFSRLDEAELKEVDLHQGIDITLNLLRNRLKNRIAVHKEYGVIPPVTCYAGQMNQVFMNLLSNAADAIEENGSIWITTGLRSGEGEEKVWIMIRDDGCGIPEKILTKIFDPFFTTKDVGQGTGLGLSISHSIVERHGGKITAAGEPGKGSTLTIEIPVRQNEP